MDKEIGIEFDFGHLFLSVFYFLKIKFTKALGKISYAVICFNHQNYHEKFCCIRI